MTAPEVLTADEVVDRLIAWADEWLADVRGHRPTIRADEWHRILAARAPAPAEPDFRPAIIAALTTRLDAVVGACDLAEAEARHVMDDEVYVSVGLIRNALHTPSTAARAPAPAVEAVLMAHRLTTPVQCACGWRETDPLCEGTWVTHVAAALRAGVAEPVETCRHGNPEKDCGACESCAACDGSCGVCPYSACAGGADV